LTRSGSVPRASSESLFDQNTAHSATNVSQSSITIVHGSEIVSASKITSTLSTTWPYFWVFASSISSCAADVSHFSPIQCSSFTETHLSDWAVLVEDLRDNKGHVPAGKALAINGWVIWAAINCFIHMIWIGCLLVCQLYQVCHCDRACLVTGD
jgi:hypothetical protein